jgi:hypothetical protein
VELVATTNYAARFGKVDKTASGAAKVRYVNGERLLGRPLAAGGD